MLITLTKWPKLYLQSVSFVLLFLLNACEENDPTDNIDNTGNDEEEKIKIEDVAEGELKAIVNGKTKSAESVSATLSDDNFSLSVIFPDNTLLTVNADTIRETGFDFTPDSMFEFAEFFSDADAENPSIYTTKASESSGGKLEITNINTTDKTLSGTYSITLHSEIPEDDSVVISSAAFNKIPFTIEVEEESSGTFTATVSGDSWSAETITAQVNRQVVFLDIKGTTEEGIDISIFMPDDIEKGVYELSGNGDYVATVYPEGESEGTHYSNSGELEIVSHDKEANTIEAKFHFDATRIGDDRVYEVRDGVFSYEGYYDPNE